MKTVIIVQARMTSTRLPGKVLLPLAREPMLARLVQRLRRVKGADTMVIATTTNAADDPIVALCEVLGVACHRGSEHDVLSRYAEAARQHVADVVVRITSDCPLIDPNLVDRMITTYRHGDCDYLSNMLPPTWPYGMAVEVFSAAALYEANQEASQDSEREHVSPFIYWHPERFRLRNVESLQNLSHHRWTVDTPEDYQLVHQLFEALYPTLPDFSLNDVLAVLEVHPGWMHINQHIVQKQAAPDISPIRSPIAEK